MPHTVNNILKEEYNRLKKVFEKIAGIKKKEQQPQLVLQPYRTKNNLRNTNLR